MGIGHEIIPNGWGLIGNLACSHGVPPTTTRHVLRMQINKGSALVRQGYEWSSQRDRNQFATAGGTREEPLDSAGRNPALKSQTSMNPSTELTGQVDFFQLK